MSRRAEYNWPLTYGVMFVVALMFVAICLWVVWSADLQVPIPPQTTTQESNAPETSP